MTATGLARRYREPCGLDRNASRGSRVNLNDARGRLSCCRNLRTRTVLSDIAWARASPLDPSRPTCVAARPALDTFPRIVEHRHRNAHRRAAVNRTELCARIAARSSLSRADAATALDAVVAAIVDALEGGEAVNITGFGTFATTHRAAREGRNPRTGEAVAVPARTVATFKPGKALRDRLNG